MHPIDIARVCHEVNRNYRRFLGETDSGAWAEISAEKRASIVTGVQFALDRPDLTPRESHERWMEDAANAGHINLVPWEQLPREQQAKDEIFLAIVRALTPFLPGQK